MASKHTSRLQLGMRRLGEQELMNSAMRSRQDGSALQSEKAPGHVLSENVDNFRILKKYYSLKVVDLTKLCTNVIYEISKI